MDVRLRATLVALTVLLAGCASSAGRAPAGGGPSNSPSSSSNASSPSSGPSGSSCTPPAGGRCPGPQPVSQLAVENSGRRLVGVFLCGGRLSGRETANAVYVTYIGSAVRTGGMSCARLKLSVTLAEPLDTRHVIDTTTRHTVRIRFCHPVRRASGDALDPCW